MDQGRPSLQLKPLHVHGAPTVIEIPEGGLTIGRDAANAIALDGDAYPQVSTYHSRVSVVDHEVILEDLDSKNGVLRVLHGKGDRARSVGLDPEAWSVIERWIEKRRERGINSRSRLFCTLSCHWAPKTGQSWAR